MGGNSKYIDRFTGTILGFADKFPLIEIGRHFFVEKIFILVNTLNSLFFNKFKENLWNFEKIPMNKFFNGSSEHLVNNQISDEEIYKAKPIVGDIDIVVPKDKLEKLFQLLGQLETIKVTDNFIYLGQNHQEFEGFQINGVWKFLSGTKEYNIQIDFEGTDFIDGAPDEYSKFSHSSSWEDLKFGIKGVAHKFLIKNLVRTISSKHIMVLTPKSSVEKPRFKKNSSNVPFRTHTFSVDSGLRQKLYPVFDNGKRFMKSSVEVWKEFEQGEGPITKNINKIFEFIFGKKPSQNERILFNSYLGILDLMRAKFGYKKIEETFLFMLEEDLWGQDAQSLDRDSPFVDAEIKDTMAKFFIEKFPELNTYLSMIKNMKMSYYTKNKNLWV